MSKVIEIENLNFGYQSDSLVLENINWTVEPGQFIAIVGPNGGGKTTLLKILLGLIQPNSGSVRIFGKKPAESFSKIAYVPQSLGFDRQFPITVLDVVLMGRLSHLPWYGRYTKDDIELANQALEKVNLLEFSNASFGELSGGQRQRTLIARALISKPQLLLLDEPTASVDVNAEADIYNILNSLYGSMTILMVTHDLQAAIDHVEHVVCVQKTLRALKKDEVCQHFAIGLYHPPLKQGKLNVIP